MRDLDTDVLNELDKDQIQIAMLAELDFVSGREYLWAGPEGVALEWDGNTYLSLADLGEIDRVSEAQGSADARSTVSLRLNSESVAGPIGSDDSRGREAVLILLLLTPSGTPIGEIRFRKTMGRLMVHTAVRTDGPSRTVDEHLSLELLDETATMGRTQYERMTYEGGLRIDPDDHGLEFVGDPNSGRAIGGLTDGRTVVLPDGTILDLSDLQERIRNITPF